MRRATLLNRLEMYNITGGILLDTLILKLHRLGETKDVTIATVSELTPYQVNLDYSDFLQIPAMTTTTSTNS